MKKNLLLCCYTIGVLAACNDTRHDDREVTTTTADTAYATVEAAPAASSGKKKVPVSGKFISLQNETDIQKLLCQGWVMDDDADVPANNNEPEGMYPYRCFYFLMILPTPAMFATVWNMVPGNTTFLKKALR